MQRIQYRNLNCLEIETDQELVNAARRKTRPGLRQRLTCGLDPVPEMDALLQILRLLEQDSASMSHARQSAEILAFWRTQLRPWVVHLLRVA